MIATSRNDETRIASAVERYLLDAGGEATISDIRHALPHYLQLSDQGRRPSLTRPGEQVWEQQVRNIVSHRFSYGNAVNVGKLKYKPRRLVLADGPQGELF